MSRKAQTNAYFILGHQCSHCWSHEPNLLEHRAWITVRSLDYVHPSGNQSNMGIIHLFRCRGLELSVDDLRTWQGVVLGRAVATLRSVET